MALFTNMPMRVRQIIQTRTTIVPNRNPMRCSLQEIGQREPDEICGSDCEDNDIFGFGSFCPRTRADLDDIAGGGIGHKRTKPPDGPEGEV